MKKDVLITIKGIQYQDEEPDTVELTTVGRFYRRDGTYYISYDESEATGFEGSKTTLKVEGEGKVTMLRRGGANSSQLIIEKGARHQCLYDTEYGSLMLGISGSRIVSSLGDDGGELNFKYTLDINASMAVENEVIINVRECPRS
ncbi:MAG: DUF1934 domain-containing protein [Oscillospiraceae bacterium]|nr:DUF1934 domain-containing protein [Oscillospiraceae bacterium]